MGPNQTSSKAPYKGKGIVIVLLLFPSQTPPLLLAHLHPSGRLIALSRWVFTTVFWIVGGSSHGRHLDGRGEASGSEAESGVILYVFVG